MCQLAAWFTFYCAPRTLSNSFETAATPIVVYHWVLAVREDKNSSRYLSGSPVRCYTKPPFPPHHSPFSRSTWLYLSLAALSFLVRPTGGLIWAPLVLLHLVWGRNTLSSLAKAAVVGSGEGERWREGGRTDTEKASFSLVCSGVLLWCGQWVWTGGAMAR